MAEKNYVVNVKTKLGTIFTVRADTATELNQNIKDVLLQGVNDAVGALEEFFTGGTSVPIVAPAVQSVAPATSNPVDTVVSALGGTVISAPAPTWAQPPAPAPVAVPEQGNNSVAPPCAHGTRTFVQAAPGSGKTWKAWMCPQPKGAVDKCDPQWIK